MAELRVGTTADLPDEYGLSSDSLRGSHHFIQPHLVDSDGIDPLTGRPNPRVSLSRNEVRALENVGILVDENGYEREPEPVAAVAPIPTVQPRVRPSDRAPAGETNPKPNPQLSVPADDDIYVSDDGDMHPPAPSSVTPSAVPASEQSPSAIAPSTATPSQPITTAVPTSTVPPYAGERPSDLSASES